MSVRPATALDADAIVALALEDAAARAANDAALWPVAGDAALRVRRVLTDELREGGRTQWLVAEGADGIAGAARWGLIPCPPIYHLAGSMAFLLYDEVFAAHTAPATFAALIGEAERRGAAAGAAIFLAACAGVQLGKHHALEAAGFRAVTHYLVKHGLRPADAPASVRAATAADIPAIVAMGAASQRSLSGANAAMWTPHPDAPARFGSWMQYSLTLADRRIFVASGHAQAGFVIAQPVSPFHLPLTSAREHVGLIDDFWAEAFAGAGGEAEARDLLTAAENEFAARGRSSAMIICPVAWAAKQRFLRGQGYRDGNAWLLKS